MQVRGARNRPTGRSGTTLVEVMFAGSLLALVCLTIMEGLVTASRLVRDENGTPLVADAYAFDALWTVFNGSSEAWPLNTEVRSRAYVIPQKDAPALYAPTWDKPKAYLTVTNAAYQSGTLYAAGKAISVNVVWGPRDRRRQLWGKPTAPCESGVTTFYDRNHPREIFRAADIDRGEAEIN